MKKKIHLFSVLLFISLLPMVFFTACDKDTNCYIEVLVVDEATLDPVSGVSVVLYQQNGNSEDFNYETGVTDANGTFSTHFVAPAIISIRARLDVANGGYREGNATVRLVEGEVKNAKVILETAPHYD